MAVSDCALPVAPQLVGNQWWSGSSARSHGDTDLFAAEVERGGLKRSSLKEFLASARDASAQLVSEITARTKIRRLLADTASSYLASGLGPQVCSPIITATPGSSGSGS
jgi:hypothetical protein